MITLRETRLLRIVQALQTQRKLVLSPGRVHKASSAEAILRHVLRQLGWTRKFNEGRLRGKSYLKILNEIRDYGRAWLRHEARVFARHYLEPVNRAIASDLAAHFGRFFRRAKGFVRELVVAGSMALSGPAPLTGEDLAGADREAQRQERFFDKFHEEVIQHPPLPFDATKTTEITVSPAPMTPNQFVARVEQYGSSTWGSSQEVARARIAREREAVEERRILGIADHCHDCPPLAEMGWRPIGSLPPIGQTECGPHCHCLFKFRDVDGNEFYAGYHVRKKP